MINRRLFIFLVLTISLLQLISAEGLKACSDTNEIDISDIPCQGVTNIISCSGNVTVNALNTSTSYQLTTISKGDGTYNFTFNFTTGSYTIIDCANNSGTVLVGDYPRDDLWKFSITLGYIGIVFILLFFGLSIFDRESWILRSFLYICSILVGLLAVSTGSVLSLNTNLSKLVSISFIIIVTTLSVFFLYVLIYFTVSTFKALKEAKEEKKTQL